MKRSLLLVVTACSAFLLGCGDGSHTISSQQVQKAKNKSEYPLKHPEMRTRPSLWPRMLRLRRIAPTSPWVGKDPKFDPKQHVEMLKKYESDSDPEVATAAKELLTKVQ